MQPTRWKWAQNHGKTAFDTKKCTKTPKVQICQFWGILSIFPRGTPPASARLRPPPPASARPPPASDQKKTQILVFLFFLCFGFFLSQFLGSFDIPPQNFSFFFFRYKKQFVLFLVCFWPFLLFGVFWGTVVGLFKSRSQFFCGFHKFWLYSPFSACLAFILGHFRFLSPVFSLLAPIPRSSFRAQKPSFFIQLITNQSFLDVHVLAPPNHAVEGIICTRFPKQLLFSKDFVCVCFFFHFVFSEIWAKEARKRQDLSESSLGLEFWRGIHTCHQLSLLCLEFIFICFVVSFGWKCVWHFLVLSFGFSSQTWFLRLIWWPLQSNTLNSLVKRGRKFCVF